MHGEKWECKVEKFEKIKIQNKKDGSKEREREREKLLGQKITNTQQLNEMNWTHEYTITCRHLLLFGILPFINDHLQIV